MTNQSNSFFKKLSEGKQEDIILLYQEVFPKIEQFVLHNNGRTGDADDIFQKALLQLIVRYRKEAFEINATFESYFFMVCKNLWRRELNTSKLTTNNLDIIKNVSEDTNTAFSIVEQERYELFTEKLASLSDNCKHILKLFFAKTAYTVIMEKFGYTSENVVRQRIFKCKKRLTTLIKKDSRYTNLKDL
ncbi:sigma-70 family RNA polymerase sigma factor [uncultured Kordia sp.]|uniref:RNA polymerase sigma factor n=1 Tax=uncultured Kordia sp. TaxID=507699 RepID=UPI0026393D4C|nr:sigma-70 family RNA polymerase sigma factor [uncultured Kordia sp.]